ncbi:efflux RND transporter periplasmic adaptor subunit [Haloferula sp.]|uniref:efflux RND transporter periplasmic adaptor subunit n=1 Tax=Haloferula sp. TaxID=2497595 RepID=UPI003C7923D9
MSTSTLDSLSRHRESAPPPRRSRAWLLPLGILLGFALLFIILFRDRLLPATPVASASVIAIPGETETTSPTPDRNSPVIFQATGWVEPDPWSVKATALIDGVVETVHVLEGQLVEQGELLATLIADDSKLALNAAEQELSRREAARDAHCAGILTTIEEMKGIQAQEKSALAVRDAAKDRLDRLERSGTRAVSERDIVDARLDYERVSALVRAAESKVTEIAARLNEMSYETVSMEHMIQAGQVAVDQAALALSRTEIRAPISGRVLRLLAAPGQKRMLGMDDPESSTIAILYDPEKLQVRVDVPLADASQLQINQAARIRCSLLPDQSFHGKVTSIVGQADIQRNTLQAKVLIEDPDDALRPEMLCRVEFLQARNGGDTATTHGLTLWIPEASIEGNRVWVIDPDSKRVSAREVTLGAKSEDRQQVLSGLRPGERIVLNPSGLKNNQRVEPKQT